MLPLSARGWVASMYFTCVTVNILVPVLLLRWNPAWKESQGKVYSDKCITSSPIPILEGKDCLQYPPGLTLIWAQRTSSKLQKGPQVVFVSQPLTDSGSREHLRVPEVLKAKSRMVMRALEARTPGEIHFHHRPSWVPCT